MMLEIPHVKQYEPGLTRRWFQNEYFDLYTWQDQDGAFHGFQLCYAKNGDQRALRYSIDAGLRHEGVNQPEEKPGRAMTAIFVADGAPQAALLQRFEEDGAALPREIFEFVSAQLHLTDSASH
jgi:hypothetical protein